MKQLILQEEGVVIEIKDSNEYEKEGVDLEVVSSRLIKHAIRYKSVSISLRPFVSVMYYALKGLKCDKDHFDIAQRQALYEHLIKEEIECPYIKQFLKETKEKYAQICL